MSRFACGKQHVVGNMSASREKQHVNRLGKADVREWADLLIYEYLQPLLVLFVANSINR